MLFTRLVAKSTNLDRVKQKFTQRYSGNFADGIKKGVKDVIDAGEMRNKNKIRQWRVWQGYAHLCATASNSK